jgi:hypothetical protein
LAKNRYGWQKRAKELARKQKQEEKMRRRQNKAAAQEVEETPELAEEVPAEELPDQEETDLQPESLPQD